jgi:uncharacterized membrane protein
LDASALSPGEYQAIVAIEHNDPAQLIPIEVPAGLSVIERQVGLLLAPSRQEGGGLSATTVDYLFAVKNAGNYTDGFSLEASGEWTATLSADTTGPLGVGETYVFTLSVSIPATAAEGNSDSATVTARSASDPGVSATAEAVTTCTGEREAGLSLTPTVQERSGLPGAAVVYTFTLTNEGNYADSFNLEASGAWPATLSAETTGLLGVGESYVFTLSVAIPAAADEGNSDMTTITARSQYDSEVWDSAEAITTAALRKLYLPLLLRNSD